MYRMRKAFTLIELLIVVAIIGILAAIAVPNFMNAKMRATIARMQSDMKAIGDAMAMYRLDNKCFFPNQGSNPANEMKYLTTPIQYIASIPHDPYRKPGLSKYGSTTQNYDYTSYGSGCRTDWCIHGLGPDTDEDAGSCGPGPAAGPDFKRLLYQMSNGLASSGDVIHNSWSGISF